MQVGSSTFSAIVTGVWQQLMTPVIRESLASAGLLDENLARGYDALEETARNLTRAGLEMQRQDLLGELIDTLG